PLNHPFRKQKSQFNGLQDKRKAPRRLTESVVLSKVENIPITYGKEIKKGNERGLQIGKKRKKPMTDKGESIGDDEEESTRVNGEESTKKPTAWSRRTIMFDLPYWKDLPVRHKLDVMHIKSNV
ncbi:hypothetical protein GIB67_008792, partial [Kingdonia uniflora]